MLVPRALAVAVLAACCVSAIVPAAHAQPPRGERSPDTTSPPPDGSMDRDNLRRRLNNRLEITRLAQQRLEEALRRLDAGDSPESIREAVAVNPRSDHPSPKDAGLAALLGELSMMERGFPPTDASPDADRRSPSSAPPSNLGSSRPPGDPRRYEAPTDEQRARAREVLSRHKPEMLALLDELRATDPELGARTFDRVTMRLRDMASTRDEDPVLFELRLDEMRTAFEVIPNARRLAALSKGAAPEPELEQARADLRLAMERQFDVRLALQRHELSRLVERVESLRDQIDRTAADRGSMVDRQMQAVLDRADDVTPVDERERRPLLERLKKFRDVRDRSTQRPRQRGDDGQPPPPPHKPAPSNPSPGGGR